MKPIDLGDIEDIAERTGLFFRDVVSRVAKRENRRRPDADEIRRISGEIERAIIEKLEEYVREYESIRDRESLVPGSRRKAAVDDRA